MARLESAKDRIELRNGTGVPCVGFGTWELPEGDAGLGALRQALADGYRHIDTAEVYGTEADVGRALRESGIAREELFVTSKVWNDHRGRDAALRAFEGSLERLGLEYLDLYLVHWPAAQGPDDEWQRTNRQTWRALEELYRDGRVRAIGVSNFKRRHLEPLMDAADILPMVNQIELHPGCAKRRRARSAIATTSWWRRGRRSGADGCSEARRLRTSRPSTAARRRSCVCVGACSAAPSRCRSPRIRRASPRTRASSGSTSRRRICSVSTRSTRSGSPASTPTRWTSKGSVLLEALRTARWSLPGSRRGSV